MNLEIIPVKIKQEIGRGDDISKLFLSNFTPKDGDIVIVTQKIISKQEGRIVDLSDVIPSTLSVGIASEYDKDPKLVQTILSETKRIVRLENGIMIVETNNGFICANAGVDESNVEDGYATLLPLNPDKSAELLRKKIQEKSGKKIAVLISDTFGRPFRLGQTDCAIGVSGLNSLLDYEGKKDTFGKVLRVTSIAIADEICAATELTNGKILQCPIAVLRNFQFHSDNGSAKSMLRPNNEDLFR